jgi:hypothetical protein
MASIIRDEDAFLLVASKLHLQVSRGAFRIHNELCESFDCVMRTEPHVSFLNVGTPQGIRATETQIAQ